MLCQNCQKNNANIKYTQIINGNKKEMVLCEECAEKLGINNFKVHMPSISSLMGDFFNREGYDEFGDSLFNIGNRLLQIPEEFGDVDRKLNEVFGIISEYENVENKDQYEGKGRSFNIEAKLNNTGENKVKSNKTKNSIEKNTKENKSEIQKINKEEEIRKLKDYLQNAIEQEKYEEAAVIRDKIKKLEN